MCVTLEVCWRWLQIHLKQFEGTKYSAAEVVADDSEAVCGAGIAETCIDAPSNTS